METTEGALTSDVILTQLSLKETELSFNTIRLGLSIDAVI